MVTLLNKKKWLILVLVLTVLTSIYVTIDTNSSKTQINQNLLNNNSKNLQKDTTIEENSSKNSIIVDEKDEEIINNDINTIEELIESTKDNSTLNSYKESSPKKEHIESIEKMDEVYSQIKSKYIKKNDSELKEIFENKLPEDTIIHNSNLDLISNLQGKPKLAIIIDDISFDYQIDSILNLNLVLNMAIMPKSKRYPNTEVIAKKLSNHLVHLPLEALSYNRAEESTLLVDDSSAKIESRIKEIRELYPNAKLINNHTGSKFTSNYQAMDRLFKALKKYEFDFIDSRTIASTVCESVAKKNHIGFNSRNIFLDNIHTFEYIQGQLKKSINMAKQKGYSIAIGHPYSITIEVLSKSKELLEDVDLVYVNDLLIEY